MCVSETVRVLIPAQSIGDEPREAERPNLRRLVLCQPAECRVGCGDVPIEPSLVEVLRRRLREWEGDTVVRQIRQRELRKQRLDEGRNRPIPIESARTVDGQWLLPALRRNRVGDRRDAKPFAEPLIREEEEQVVALQWPADRAAIVVALEWRQPIRRDGCTNVEEVARVESAVPKVFEHRPVEAVRAALGHDGHLTAHRHPVLGAQRVGDDAPLLNTFDAEGGVGHRTGAATEHVDHRGPVDHVGVRSHGGTVAAVPAPDERAARCHVLLARDAGLQEGQIDEVAAVERKVGHRLRIDERTERCAGGVHERRLGRHRHGFGERANFEGEIDDRLLTDGQRQPVADGGAKAIDRRTYFVTAHGQRRKPVRTVRVRHRRARQCGVGISDRERHAGNDTGGRIPDGAKNRRRRKLRRRGRSGREQHQD